jgi:hypothetical protein
MPVKSGADGKQLYWEPSLFELRSPAAVDHNVNFALHFVAVMRSRNFRAANGLDTLLGSVCPYVSLPLTIFFFWIQSEPPTADPER